ncbi:hypothetical protein LHJ74_28785 [Streptomyces sp. N2-109]|uniref:Uncharacterized protein n=1 Tax=Streptomyces gossypii TaxID=2883101 RepID=A0ABT2K119_9ACTN|nr:hypothetical protein [Streptomyces gossypii]MCT2593856.1 hypothetical protein [Streptomyces gossypii]
MCENGPVEWDEHITEVSSERVWTGESADGQGRQEIIRLDTESPARATSTSRLLVGVDEPRHLTYLSKPQESGTGDTHFDSLYGVCASWDGRVVVADGSKVTRIEVTELGSGETYTADGDSLVARRKVSGDEPGALTAAVTRTRRHKGGRETPYTGVIHCHHALDTPDF